MTNGVCAHLFSLSRALANNSQWSGFPHPTQPGQVGGHEGVGRVVKLGADTESSNLKIGDRVGVKWVSSACGHCRTYTIYSLQQPRP